MDARTRRRKRLEQLLELAQAYRGWSRRELGKALRRDPTWLVPESGIPKLDLVVDLAKLLDWPIGLVAADLWVDDGPPVTDGQAGKPAQKPGHSEYDVLQEGSVIAQREGRYSKAVTLAQQAYEVAETSEQRALACNREAVAWDGLGQFTTALEVEQRGLQEPSLSTGLRLMLESNLANSYYTLWSLPEARSIARDLIDWYRTAAPTQRTDRVTQAFAHYVHGNALRRLMSVEPERAQRYAERAVRDLKISQRLYTQLAEEFKEDSYAGIGNTCRAGIIEAEVELGRRDVDEALTGIADGLEAVAEPDECPPGDWLESYGWACIFGCNIALRHMPDERKLQRFMALFTNKADEIAERIDNWSLRERVFTMQYASQQRFVRWTGTPLPVTFDRGDLRALVGTMGRFPTFRETGWKLLQTARVVRDE